MKITYKDCKTFTPAQLETLFCSVKWESGKYPERLAQAMRGSSCFPPGTGNGWSD